MTTMSSMSMNCKFCVVFMTRDEKKDLNIYL